MISVQILQAIALYYISDFSSVLIFTLARESRLKLSSEPGKHIVMESQQTQNTSLQRLQNVEKSVVRVLELAGGVMDEMSNPAGPRKEFVDSHCREFMQLIKDIQVTLREEIKSACEYRPFEKCDYSSRIANEICCKKLEHIFAQLDGMKQTVEGYHGAIKMEVEHL